MGKRARAKAKAESTAEKKRFEASRTMRASERERVWAFQRLSAACATNVFVWESCFVRFNQKHGTRI